MDTVVNVDQMDMDPVPLDQLDPVSFPPLTVLTPSW